MSTVIMNQLTITEVDASNQAWIAFYENWKEDIYKFFPHFSEDDAMFSEILMLSKEDEIIGAFVYQDKGTELHIDLDYVSPANRNLGIGIEFFEQKRTDFQKAGFKKLSTLTNNQEHINYILNVGFVSSPKHPDLYEMELNRDRII